MKFLVTMKSPDSLDYAITDAIIDPMDERDIQDAMEETRDEREEVKNLCEKWFKYGELLTVEIDTESGTCVVLETT